MRCACVCVCDVYPNALLGTSYIRPGQPRYKLYIHLFTKNQMVVGNIHDSISVYGTNRRRRRGRLVTYIARLCRCTARTLHINWNASLLYDVISVYFLAVVVSLLRIDTISEINANLEYILLTQVVCIFNRTSNGGGSRIENTK